MTANALAFSFARQAYADYQTYQRLEREASSAPSEFPHVIACFSCRWRVKSSPGRNCTELSALATP